MPSWSELTFPQPVQRHLAETKCPALELLGKPPGDQQRAYWLSQPLRYHLAVNWNSHSLSREVRQKMKSPTLELLQKPPWDRESIYGSSQPLKYHLDVNWNSHSLSWDMWQKWKVQHQNYWGDQQRAYGLSQTPRYNHEMNWKQNSTLWCFAMWFIIWCKVGLKKIFYFWPRF